MDVMTETAKVRERNRRDYEFVAALEGKTVAEVDADTTARDPELSFNRYCTIAAITYGRDRFYEFVRDTLGIQGAMTLARWRWTWDRYVWLDELETRRDALDVGVQ